MATASIERPLRYPSPSSVDAQSVPILLDSIARLAPSVDPKAIDEAGRLAPDLLARAGEIGLFALIIPVEHGGLGLGMMGFARIMHETAARLTISLAATIGAHQGIGLSAVVQHGTAEQRSRYLPRCASGDLIAALAVTEPESGSQFSALSTKARRGAGGWVLDGAKTYITNGGIAGIFTLFAQALDGNGRGRISAFLVERAHGVVSGPPMPKMGLRGSNTTELFLDGVVVPGTALLGRVGDGLAILRDVMSHGRLGLAAASAGTARQVFALSREHALDRRLAGQPIARFGMVREHIVQMAVDTYAAESMLYLTAGAMDRMPHDVFYETAMAKVFCTERVCAVADRAVQVAGGSGYVKGPLFELLYRDVRIAPIFEGTNEVLRALIAMGSMRGVIDRLARLRAALGEPDAELPDVLQEDAARVTRCVTLLEEAIESVFAKHGSSLSSQQLRQRRLADAHTDVYAMVCCLARVCAEAGDSGRAEASIAMTRLFTRQAEERVRKNLAELDSPELDLTEEIGAAVLEDGLPSPPFVGW